MRWNVRTLTAGCLPHVVHECFYFRRVTLRVYPEDVRVRIFRDADTYHRY